MGMLVLPGQSVPTPKRRRFSSTSTSTPGAKLQAPQKSGDGKSLSLADALARGQFATQILEPATPAEVRGGGACDLVVGEKFAGVTFHGRSEQGYTGVEVCKSVWVSVCVCVRGCARGGGGGG